MTVDEILKSITERIRATARTETIFGEPSEVSGKTIIPIASVSYGFGAGTGEGKGKPGEEEETEGAGGGGGGGISVEPVGFLVSDEEGMKFLPTTNRKRIIAAALAGFFIGITIAKKLTSK
jgi:uncharacterized spore protein YtfJ